MTDAQCRPGTGAPGDRSVLPTGFGLLLAAVLVVVGLYIQEPGLTALGVLAVCAPGLARAWARGALWRVRLEQRLTPDRVFVGDEVHWTLRIRNGKPLPVHLELLAPLAAAADGVPATVTLAPLAHRQWVVAMRPHRRGRYPRGPVVLQAGDPWGFFIHVRPVADDGAIWVYPRIYPLETPVRWWRPGTDGRAVPFGPYPNRLYPAGLRDGPVAPVRDIDWRATARRQRLQFRQYDASVEAGVLALLHVETPPKPTAGGVDTARDSAMDTARESAISLCASLLWDRLRDGASVAWLTNGVTRSPVPMPGLFRVHSQAAFHSTLEALAVLAPGPHRDWTALLGGVGVGPGTTVAIISTGRLPAALRAFGLRHRAHFFVAVDPAGEPPADTDLAAPGRPVLACALAAGRIVCRPVATGFPGGGIGSPAPAGEGVPWAGV